MYLLRVLFNDCDDYKDYSYPRLPLANDWFDNFLKTARKRLVYMKIFDSKVSLETPVRIYDRDSIQVQ